MMPGRRPWWSRLTRAVLRAVQVVGYGLVVLPYAWLARRGRRLDPGPQASYWIPRRHTGADRDEFEHPG